MEKFVKINEKVYNTRNLQMGKIVQTTDDKYYFMVWSPESVFEIESRQYESFEGADYAQDTLIRFLNRAMASPMMELPKIEI